MIITVQGTQVDKPVTDPAEVYVLKTAHEKSKAPYAFFLFLMGIGLYLKSIFPGWTQVLAETPSEPADRTSDPDVAQLAPLEDPQALAEDLTTGTVGQGPGPGAFSGGTLIDLQAWPKFQLIGSPQIDFFLPTIETDPFSLVEPYRQNLRATNDNLPSFTGGSSAPGRPGIPGATVGDGEDDGDTGGPGTDGPGDGGPGDGDPGDGDPFCAGPGTGGPCDDDDDEDDEETANRAPRVASAVTLYDITACVVMVIALGDLLRGATDPDGDVLSVSGLAVSSGTLTATDTGWTFAAAPFSYGLVTLSYLVTDGALSVAQTAWFSVLERGRFGGTEGDDTLLGSLCGDDIEGGAGDDHIDARAGNDVIHSGAGNDHIVAGSGDDTVFAGAGNDIVFAGLGNDIVFGGAGNDRLFGEDGNDILFGEEDDDVLSGGAGDDLLFGGEGRDILQGDDGIDMLDGGRGADQLFGGADNDRLFGADGDDLLDGGTGDDVLSDGAGADAVDGGAGNDTLIAALDGEDDAYEGGDGLDALDYSVAQLRLAIDLEQGAARGEEIGCDTIEGFEKVIAGAGDDQIVGSDDADHIVANAGDDQVAAGAGNDMIEDGAGSDTIDAGTGNDTLVAAMDGTNDAYEGGADHDTLDYSAAGQGLLIALNEGAASGIEIGIDSISGFEAVKGGAGDDHFQVGGEEVELSGGGGDNIFEFVGSGEDPAQPLVYLITDFKAGDRVRMDKYDLFQKVFDDLENQFEAIYGADVLEHDFAIRTRLEEFDGKTQTFVEADLDRDDTFETTIIIDGRHVFVMVETA